MKPAKPLTSFICVIPSRGLWGRGSTPRVASANARKQRSTMPRKQQCFVLGSDLPLHVRESLFGELEVQPDERTDVFVKWEDVA